MRWNLDAELGPDQFSEALLVTQLDGRPLFAEGGIFGVLGETLKQGEVLEPGLRTERLSDKRTELWVALIKPPAGRDAVSDVCSVGSTGQGCLATAYVASRGLRTKEMVAG